LKGGVLKDNPIACVRSSSEKRCVLATLECDPMPNIAAAISTPPGIRLGGYLMLPRPLLKAISLFRKLKIIPFKPPYECRRIVLNTS